uniref:Uncharacterized protein n=1 Tax=Photinus pyralis TaxID=7054 RepID=A0A1Y1JZ82_PHOPY
MASQIIEKIGVYFCRKMWIIPNLRDKEWRFVAESEIHLDHPEQIRDLDSLIESSFFHAKQDVGCMHFCEHKIKSSAEPIRQMYYPVSPVVQKQIDEEHITVGYTNRFG